MWLSRLARGSSCFNSQTQTGRRTATRADPGPCDPIAPNLGSGRVVTGGGDGGFSQRADHPQPRGHGRLAIAPIAAPVLCLVERSIRTGDPDIVVLRQVVRADRGHAD